MKVTRVPAEGLREFLRRTPNATSPRHFDLPPKPTSIATAYRRAHNLGEPVIAGNSREAVAERYVQELGRCFTLAGSGFSDYSRSAEEGVRLITERSVKQFLEHGIDAKTLFVEMSELSSSRDVSQVLQADWVRAFLASDALPEDARCQWFGLYQEVSWTNIMRHFGMGDITATCDELRAFAALISAHSYLSAHSHFGSLPRVIGNVAHFFETTRARCHPSIGRLVWREPQTELHTHLTLAAPSDAVALRLNPWASLESMREHRFMQVLEGGSRFDLEPASDAEDLRAWAAMTQPLERELDLGLTRITMDEPHALQVVERMVDMGTFALRAVAHDAQQVGAIARTMWELLSHNEVYPHIAYFNSTRLAMGLLAEDNARRFGSAPTFTPALRGFAELFRRHQEDDDLCTPYALFIRALDPLGWYVDHLPHDPILSLVADYLHRAHAQGLFERSYAEAMRDSVTIHEPNHAAAAIVIHDDGGEA